MWENTFKRCDQQRIQFTSVQSLSRVWLCDPMDFSTPGIPVHHQLPEYTQTHVHWVGDTIQPSYPLLSPSPPTFNLSQHQGLFQWVSSLHQVAKGLEFQLQHQSFQWIFRIDFFRMDWLDLAIQGMLKSLLQHHSSKVSIFCCSDFFMVQLSHHILVPSLQGKYKAEKLKQWQTLFLGAPESLQMVTADMKLKDACSLEEKLWPT